MKWVDDIEKKNSCPTWPEAPLCEEVTKLIAAVRLAEKELSRVCTTPGSRTGLARAEALRRLRSGEVE
jgi:hypothetical protein